MNWRLRFRYWIAQPLLDRLRVELGQTRVDFEREAYRLGHEAGFLRGQALGQLQGQQHLLAQIGQYMDERHAETVEVTVEDIERAKKGILH